MSQRLRSSLAFNGHEPYVAPAELPRSAMMWWHYRVADFGGTQVAELVSVGSQPEERFGLLGRQTVGREPSCDIVLLRASVSRRHAVLSTENGRKTVEDLDSKNGTFVNNEAVEVRMLVNGDRIRFGDQVFELAGDMVGPTVDARLYGKLRIDERTRRVWRKDQEFRYKPNAPRIRSTCVQRQTSRGSLFQ